MWVSALLAYSRAEQILNSIRFDMFEGPPIEASINSTCSDYGLSEIKLVKNCNLFEKLLQQTLCYDVDRKEMLQYSKVLSMRLRLIVNKR